MRTVAYDLKCQNIVRVLLTLTDTLAPDDGYVFHDLQKWKFCAIFLKQILERLFPRRDFQMRVLFKGYVNLHARPIPQGILGFMYSTVPENNVQTHEK
jgi:hypothetical protein